MVSIKQITTLRLQHIDQTLPFDKRVEQFAKSFRDIATSKQQSKNILDDDNDVLFVLALATHNLDSEELCS